MTKNPAIMFVHLQRVFCDKSLPYGRAKDMTATTAERCAEFATTVRDQLPIVHVGRLLPSDWLTPDKTAQDFFMPTPQLGEAVFWSEHDPLILSPIGQPRPDHPFLGFAREKRLTDIFIAGVNTSKCVISVGLSIKTASNLNVTIVEDLCGDTYPNVHALGLRYAREMHGIQTTSSRQILAQLGIK